MFRYCVKFTAAYVNDFRKFLKQQEAMV